MVSFSPPRHRSRNPRESCVDATTISSLNMKEGNLLDVHYPEETGRDAVTDENRRITTLRTAPQSEINGMVRKH